MNNFIQLADTLRGRFMRCKRVRSLDEIAPELDASPQTLRTFVRGGWVNGKLLVRLENWCDAEEEKLHNQDAHHAN